MALFERLDAAERAVNESSPAVRSDEEPGRAVHPCLSRGSSTAVGVRQLMED
jgi:hypothetical protein